MDIKGLKTADELGIFADPLNKYIPYYGVELTKEELDKLPIKFTAKMYQTDGKWIFDVRDKDGNLTGSKIFYVMFM